MFIVVMSTTWWASSLKPTDDRHPFEEAVDDIRWVIKQILKSLPASGTANTTHDTPPPADAQKSMPAAAKWSVRPGGKRQPKLTHKLLES